MTSFITGSLHSSISSGQVTRRPLCETSIISTSKRKGKPYQGRERRYHPWFTHLGENEYPDIDPVFGIPHLSLPTVSRLNRILFLLATTQRDLETQYQTSTEVTVSETLVLLYSLLVSSPVKFDLL